MIISAAAVLVLPPNRFLTQLESFYQLNLLLEFRMTTFIILKLDFKFGAPCWSTRATLGSMALRFLAFTPCLSFQSENVAAGGGKGDRDQKL